MRSPTLSDYQVCRESAIFSTLIIQKKKKKHITDTDMFPYCNFIWNSLQGKDHLWQFEPNIGEACCLK